MGDMADYYDASDVGPTAYWKQADGSYIKISDMEDSHLANAVACCEKWGHPSLEELSFELETRASRAESGDQS